MNPRPSEHKVLPNVYAPPNRNNRFFPKRKVAKPNNQDPKRPKGGFVQRPNGGLNSRRSRRNNHRKNRRATRRNNRR